MIRSANCLVRSLRSFSSFIILISHFTHAAGAAGGVVDAAFVGGEHLDEAAHDAGRGVELAAVEVKQCFAEFVETGGINNPNSGSEVHERHRKHERPKGCGNCCVHPPGDSKNLASRSFRDRRFYRRRGRGGAYGCAARWYSAWAWGRSWRSWAMRVVSEGWVDMNSGGLPPLVPPTWLMRCQKAMASAGS